MQFFSLLCIVLFVFVFYLFVCCILAWVVRKVDKAIHRANHFQLSNNRCLVGVRLQRNKRLMTGLKGDREFGFPEILNIGGRAETHCFPWREGGGGQPLSTLFYLPTQKQNKLEKKKIQLLNAGCHTKFPRLQGERPGR